MESPNHSPCLCREIQRQVSIVQLVGCRWGVQRIHVEWRYFLEAKRMRAVISESKSVVEECGWWGRIERLCHSRWYRGKVLSHLSVHPHLVMGSSMSVVAEVGRCLSEYQLASVLSRSEVVLEKLEYVDALQDVDDEECESDQAVLVEFSVCPD